MDDSLCITQVISASSSGTLPALWHLTWARSWFSVFFSGCAAAGPLAIDPHSIEDMYSDKKETERPTFILPSSAAKEELRLVRHRDRSLLLVSITSMLGPCIGPVFGGVLAGKEGWRWTFWLVAIALSQPFAVSTWCIPKSKQGGLLTIVAMVMMSETNGWAILEGGIGKFYSVLRSRKSRHWLLRRPLFQNRPFKSLVTSWTVLAAVLYLALMKGYMYILYTTLTPVLTSLYQHATKWHLTPGQAGLSFIAIVVGTGFASLIGYVLFMWRRDELDKKMGRRGLSQSQYLPLTFVPSSLFTSFGFIAFGWTVVKESQSTNMVVSQIIAPLAAATLAGAGIALGILTAETLIYRTFHRPIADAVPASNFLASLTGGLFPLVAQGFYLLPLGVGWTNTTCGIGAFFILERTWYLYRNGKNLGLILARRSRGIDDAEYIYMEPLETSRL